jgi:RHS repeat-associated protein
MLKTLTAALTRLASFRFLPFVFILLAASFVGTGHAQTTSTTDGYTPSGISPGAPAGSYPLSGFDNVNPYNGGLNFSLPLLKVGGRGGASYTMQVPVEARWRASHTVSCDSGGPDPGAGPCFYFDYPEYDWWAYFRSYGPGMLVGRRAGQGNQTQGAGCHYSDDTYLHTITRLTFISPDGTEIELRDQLTGGQPAVVPYCAAGGASRGTVFVTTDGTSATFISDSTIYDEPQAGGLEYPSGYLLMRDGTRYRIDVGHVSWMRDRNGNRLTFGETATTFTATDSLGRQTTVEKNVTDAAPYGLCDRITYSGFGGAARVIRVSKTKLANALRSGYSPQTERALWPDLNASQFTFHDPDVISAIWLPDGRSYKLYYNSYGELARVELPTGGAIEYDWAAGANGASTSSAYGVGTMWVFAYRRVVERRVYPGGGTGSAYESRMTFSRPESTSDGSFFTNAGFTDVKQFDAAGALLAAARHYYHGSATGSMKKGMSDATGYAGWKEGREWQTEALAADGSTVLRRENNAWEQRAPVSWWTGDPEEAPSNDPRVREAVSTLADTNEVSKREFSYDQYNNRTDVYEYDFGSGVPGALVRRSHTDYLTSAVYIDAVTGPHLRGLPHQQWVSTDAAGTNKVALTTYGYDQTVLTPRPGITGHDASFTTGYLTRGNTTTVTRYADAAAGTGAVTSTHAYDVAGNVVSSTDARGKTSQIGYADSFCNGSTCGGTYTPNTYAFPTSTTSPVPDPSGTHGSDAALAASAVYDFWAGLTYSTTDANGETTTLSYADSAGSLDPLDRLKAVTRPDGGRTDFNYGDAAGNLYVQVFNDLDGTRRTESKQYFDGLGRVYRDATHENAVAAQPWLNADTEYDALGRAVRASMPYRSAGGGTPLTPSGWSNARRVETAYDALGRVLKVTTMPDGARVRTDYSGSRVLVTDQADRQRVSESDVFGRLTAVWEVTPDDSVKYPGIGPVSFAPAAGVPTPAAGYLTTYDYDALGNLRKVLQGTQSRFFAYDSLGRLIRAKNPEQGAFTAGGEFPTLTDPVSGNGQWSMGYVYDANSNLTKRVDARGTTAAYGYDALNRNITVSYTPGGTMAATPAVSRHYDNPAQGANGLGRPWKSEALQTAQTVVDSYDAAGRPKGQTQKFWAGGQWGQAYSTQLSYNLGGGVTSMIYPSGHGVSYNYDAAGRLGDNGAQPAFKGTLGDGVERTYASQVSYDELGGMREEKFGTQVPLYRKLHYNARGQLYDVRLSTVGWATDQWEWNRGAVVNYYDGNCQWQASDVQNNGNLRCSEHAVPLDPNGSYTLGAASSYSTSFQTYSYDALNRLTGVSEKKYTTGGSLTPAFTQAYTYDRWGNLTIDAAATQVYGQNPGYSIPEPQFGVDAQTNRLGVPAGQSGQMTYDPAGNLTTDTYQGGEGGGGSRAYDAEGRMTSAQFLAGQTQTATYTYDADGHRVRRNLGAGGEVWQVYGLGGELLAEYAPNASPLTPQKEYGYRSGELLVTADAPTRLNVALASAGATATAQSYTPDGVFAGLHFQPSYANDGVRYATPQGDHYWRDGPGLPSWLQIDFAGEKTIDEVDVYTLADYPAYQTQADPSATQTFTQYGVSSFEVQYWTGITWAPVPGGSVSGNGLVWRKVTFPAVTTSRLRVAVNAAPDGRVRVVEVEAWGSAAQPRVNVALQSQGGSATASTTTPDTEFPGLTFPIASINNGDRKGLNWEHGGGWRDGTNNSYQDWAQVEFAGEKSIDEIDVFTLQDATSSPSEPTAAMTFTQYGVTAYDVEYWSGTAWVAVPGGSVSGNDKVWRKFTFPAVTTSKVRVTINNALAGRSRLVEVEAWGTQAAGATAGVRWLVTDHLGTPRMVVDQTGNLAGVTRHDYLPFGEEIGAGVGGRTTVQGYRQFEGVRQGFTGYEKDAETKLNFAQARYHSPSQGRFISVDPLLASGTVGNPHSWNRYAYALNNPFRFTDPTGLVACPPGRKCVDEGTPNEHYYDSEEGADVYSASGGPPASPLSGEATVSSAPIHETGHSGNISNLMGCPANSGCGRAGRDLAYTGFPFSPIGGVVQRGEGLVARFFNWLLGKTPARQMIGTVTREAIERAAADTGPMIQVVTNQTGALQAGRGVYLAVGEGAQAMAGAARSGGQLYAGSIPKALVETLKNGRLLTEGKLVWEHANKQGLQYYVEAPASEFIIPFLKPVP